MFYVVPSSAYPSRFFSAFVHYSDVDFTSLVAIVDAYRQRVAGWYFAPAKELAKSIHFAFPVMAINCLLIDALSQFVSGKESSDPVEFVAFVRTRLPPDYRTPVLGGIRHHDGKRERSAALNDVAEVIYYGFRCGVVHQAHVSPYGSVAPGDGSAVAQATGLVSYGDNGNPCPSVIVNPLLLLKDLETAFEQYLRDLLNPNRVNDQLRENFKMKFSSSFGVDVTSAS